LDTFERISSKLENTEYRRTHVPEDVKMKVLEAARLTGSGVNSQHWRFVLVQGHERLKTLAADSSTGGWVAGCDFAVLVLTDAKRRFHALDAGRAVQSMQLAAWNYGVGSRIYTGFKPEAMKSDFGIPDDPVLTVVVGFGYPKSKVIGRKDRLPLSKIAYRDRYGEELGPGVIARP
jgi:nitroreductase